MSIRLKRIYEKVDPDDGVRVLVDRIWPRGISKEKAKLDVWMKEVAPTSELRKEFNHDPQKFPEFKKRYIEELSNGVQKESLQKLIDMISHNETVTLLYGAKDTKHNQAVLLKEIIEDELV
ncbi:DUF488 domain-containing protein [Oceanobacillus senegalensis]|uniref:DUF488 domain-containing protein n=1 Tax=Oceanobacillus senegalensis TaxID=1936063 RepID=UPI000A307170|nr:DUF488 domain-containing protein [Oceanobacillus senegalensis]